MRSDQPRLLARTGCSTAISTGSTSALDNFDVYYYDDRKKIATEAIQYTETEFDRITDLIGWPSTMKSRYLFTIPLRICSRATWASMASSLRWGSN